MRRFNISMIDLMTVLLLTVMALISSEGRPARRSGDVDQAFVMISGEIISEHGKLESVVWKEARNPVAELNVTTQ